MHDAYIMPNYTAATNILSQLPYHTRPGVTSLIMRIRNPRLQFFVRNAAQTVHLPLALICP